ncbi:all trans-polyprenyl-diphosphate synthase PDSS2-like [Anopheles ziemanni]|uniref:all trans-polyprenyl-diphosphate synthase PDSS2-like n=1 Tax=Anopheles coustani TaxID=139045 RepID=UPI0026581357|nr:all trans-polyprenyl-diphosphate synthase PDSS2-like [Anopheles coustani]XP_058177881.1 all trans-polyprenyl-diphosphate synthase PDSS2-like [Anopheles ziemanni]
MVPLDEHRRYNSSTSGQFQAKLVIKNVPGPDWIRTIRGAENLVGYETSFLSLREFFNNENEIVGLQLQERISCMHPLFNVFNSITYLDEKLLAWGLVMLLVSKATANGSDVQIADHKRGNAGVLQSQRTLAEVTETVRTSQLVHQAIQNLPPCGNAGNDLSGESAMVYGNKIALLGGDHLLARAFQQLSTLRNQELILLMSSAFRDLTESNFIGERDDQNNPLPGKPLSGAKVYTEEVGSWDKQDFGDLDDNIAPLQVAGNLGSAEMEWSLRNLLAGGSLLGKGCQGAILLGGHPEHLQRRGYLFGRHLALAWQASLDLQPFLPTKLQEGSKFSLVSAPILFHLEHEKTLYDEIEKGLETVDNIDYTKVHRMVAQGPGVEKTKVLQRKHSAMATSILHELPLTDARVALQNILLAMQEL